MYNFFSKYQHKTIIKFKIFRLKMDKENLLKQSSTVTNQLLSVSRQLANTSQQSLDTLETLCKIILLNK
jgi:uncharacterized phage-associated protein